MEVEMILTIGSKYIQFWCSSFLSKIILQVQTFCCWFSFAFLLSKHLSSISLVIFLKFLMQVQKWSTQSTKNCLADLIQADTREWSKSLHTRNDDVKVCSVHLFHVEWWSRLPHEYLLLLEFFLKIICF